MSHKDKNELLQKFIDEDMKQLRAKIRTMQDLLAQAELSDQKRRKVGRQLAALQLFETDVVKEINTLKNMDFLNTGEINNVFEGVARSAKNLVEDIKKERSLMTIVMDSLKSFANLCVKLITFGYSKGFFKTSTQHVGHVGEQVKHLQKSLDKHLDDISRHLPAEDLVPPSQGL